MLILLALAYGAPIPPPDPAPPARMEGFLAVWVDADAFADRIRPVEPLPASASAHEHPATPGRLVILRPDPGATLDAVIAAIGADPRAVVQKRDDAANTVLVDHPAALELLELPAGERPLGEIASLHAVPNPMLGGMPLPPARADLPVENASSARAILLVDGVKVGEIAPYATAVIRGVLPGTYALSFQLPNGTVRRARAHTGEGLSTEPRARD